MVRRRVRPTRRPNKPNKSHVTYCRERRAIFSTFDPLFFSRWYLPAAPESDLSRGALVIVVYFHPFFSVRFAFSPPLYIRVIPQASPCIPLVKNSSTFLFCELLAQYTRIPCYCRLFTFLYQNLLRILPEIHRYFQYGRPLNNLQEKMWFSFEKEVGISP